MSTRPPVTRRVIAFLAASTVLLTLVGIASNAERIEFGGLGEPSTTSQSVRAGGGENVEDLAVIPDEEPQTEFRRAELPDWFIWILGAIAAIAALWFLTRQRFRVLAGRRRAARVETASTMTVEEQAEVIADFADDLIAELETGGEPRVAIQRVYGAVETGFGMRELRRKPAETPLKYLDRIFGRRAQAAEPLSRLTAHFQVARFSDEPVTDEMRDDAIDALRTIRDEYRAVGRARVFGR